MSSPLKTWNSKSTNWQEWCSQQWQQERSCQQTKKHFPSTNARNMARRLQVNDIVMMKALNRQSKQDERWEGPFKIVSVESNGYIIMNDLGEIRSHPVPRSCLRKIRSRDESKGGWWEVTKIVDHRNGADGSVEYNTFFAGYDDPFWIHET